MHLCQDASSSSPPLPSPPSPVRPRRRPASASRRPEIKPDAAPPRRRRRDPAPRGQDRRRRRRPDPGQGAGRAACSGSPGRRTSWARSNKHGSSSRILRFAADGTRTVLARGPRSTRRVLSADGLRVFATAYRDGRSDDHRAGRSRPARWYATGFRGLPQGPGRPGRRGSCSAAWGRRHALVGPGDRLGHRSTKRVGGAADLEERPAAELHHGPLQRRLHGGQPVQRDRATTCGSRARGARGVVLAERPPDRDRRTSSPTGSVPARSSGADGGRASSWARTASRAGSVR